MRRQLSPTKALAAWMALNGVQTRGVEVRDLKSGSGRGIVATAIAEEKGTLFVRVPSSLLLNRANIWDHAKVDKHLCEVLEANGEFAKVCYSQHYQHCFTKT